MCIFVCKVVRACAHVGVFGCRMNVCLGCLAVKLYIVYLMMNFAEVRWKCTYLGVSL